MIFIIILLFLFVLIYLSEIVYIENFLICDRIPSGPYKTKCTNIKLNDNILYALCLVQNSDNSIISTQLDLTNCIRDMNDCDSINIDSTGNLVCE